MIPITPHEVWSQSLSSPLFIMPTYMNIHADSFLGSLLNPNVFYLSMRGSRAFTPQLILMSFVRYIYDVLLTITMSTPLFSLQLSCSLRQELLLRDDIPREPSTASLELLETPHWYEMSGKPRGCAHVRSEDTLEKSLGKDWSPHLWQSRVSESRR